MEVMWTLLDTDQMNAGINVTRNANNDHNLAFVNRYTEADKD